MKLSSETTIIAPEKLRDYLLNPLNQDGKSKARYLSKIGYQQNNWQRLEFDLREQHLSIEAKPGKISNYGTKYEIIAPLVGPNGKERWVRSIWIARKNEFFARFVTLIPEKQS